VTLTQAKQHFQAADTAYDALKRHAPAYRYDFLCDRVANKSGKVPIAAQKAASRMLQQEKQRSKARHLKRVLAKVQGGAITRIKVMEEVSMWKNGSGQRGTPYHGNVLRAILTNRKYTPPSRTHAQCTWPICN
jgi:hypothetical protein